MHYPIIHAVLESNHEDFVLPSINDLKESLPYEEDFVDRVLICDYCTMIKSNDDEDYSDLKEGFESDSLFKVEDVEDNEDYFKVSITLEAVKEYQRSLNKLTRQYLDLVDRALEHDHFFLYNASNYLFTKEERELIHEYNARTSTSGDTVLSILYHDNNKLEPFEFLQKHDLVESAKINVSTSKDFVFYVTTAFIGDYHY